MIYMYQQGNKCYVAEGQSIEEAVIKFFNMMLAAPEKPRTFDVGGITITECPERLVSTPETREILYGVV